MDSKLIERFWKYVDKSGGDEACWTWLAYRESKKGHEYGRLSRSEGQSPYYAHRLSYEIAHGSIPNGLEVCHQCDNPGCVNPMHLFLGTHEDNMDDASQKGRVRGKVMYGEENPSSVLTWEKVRAIRSAYKTKKGKYTRGFDGGVTLKSLARQHGVSFQTIQNIVKNEIWKES